MKLSYFISLASLATSLASSKPPSPDHPEALFPSRDQFDVPFYSHMYRRIIRDTKQLRTALSHYDGTDPVPVVAASSELHNSIKDSYRVLQQVHRVRIIGTGRLTKLSWEMFKETEYMVEDFKDKRDTVISSNHCELVRIDIDGMAEVGLEWLALLTSKLAPIVMVGSIRGEKRMFELEVDLKWHFNKENCPQLSGGNSTVPSLRGRGVRH